MNNIRLQICTSLFRSATNVVALENVKSMLARNAKAEGPGSEGSALTNAAGKEEVKLPNVTVKRDLPKVGRNEKCPCGSGKKYKHCHGS